MSNWAIASGLWRAASSRYPALISCIHCERRLPPWLCWLGKAYTSASLPACLCLLSARWRGQCHLWSLWLSPVGPCCVWCCWSSSIPTSFSHIAFALWIALVSFPEFRCPIHSCGRAVWSSLRWAIAGGLPQGCKRRQVLQHHTFWECWNLLVCYWGCDSALIIGKGLGDWSCSIC